MELWENTGKHLGAKTRLCYIEISVLVRHVIMRLSCTSNFYIQVLKTPVVQACLYLTWSPTPKTGFLMNDEWAHTVSYTAKSHMQQLTSVIGAYLMLPSYNSIKRNKKF